MGAAGTGSICVDVPLICSLASGCYERPAMRGSPARWEGATQPRSHAAGRSGRGFQVQRQRGILGGWDRVGAGGREGSTAVETTSHPTASPAPCCCCCCTNAARQRPELAHCQMDLAASMSSLGGGEPAGRTRSTMKGGKELEGRSCSNKVLLT